MFSGRGQMTLYFRELFQFDSITTLLGALYGCIVGIAMLAMFFTQFKDAMKNRFSDYRFPGDDKKMKHKMRWRNLQIIFGRPKWSWLLPVKPDNGKYDPLLVNIKQEMSASEQLNLLHNLIQA